LPSSRIVAVVTFLAFAMGAESARADVELQAAAIGGVAWTRSAPTLQTAQTTLSSRELRETDVEVGGSLLAVGGGFDLGLALDDHVFLPGFGFAGYGAVGSYDAVLTSADGSIVRARPWTMYRFDALLPGVGYRMKARRFMFVASLRTGFSSMHMVSSIASGADATEVSLSAVSGILQVELEACRRLDPVTRICGQLAPRIYDFGFLNGATLGLRVEWGR
jgi:hypothetical protein